MLPTAPPSEALAFGRRLVPFGFDAIPLLLPRRAFTWGGFLHAFDAELGAYVPVAVAVRRPPSVWLPGPPTEPMIDLAAIAVEEFSPVEDIDAADEFTASGD